MEYNIAFGTTIRSGKEWQRQSKCNASTREDLHGLPTQSEGRGDWEARDVRKVSAKADTIARYLASRVYIRTSKRGWCQ